MNLLKKRLLNAIEDMGDIEMVAITSLIQEYKSACEKHPEWPRDPIHSAAIVAEESGELIRAALQVRYEDGEIGELIKESCQTGAMGLRFLVNILDPSRR